MKLTNKFIKENSGMTLKEAFPEVFEGLKTSVWYKYINSDTLVFAEDIKQKKGYGFYDGEFEKSSDKWAFYLADKWIEATNEEVLEALSNEAVKKYLIGSSVNCLYDNRSCKVIDGVMRDTQERFYLDTYNQLWMYNGVSSNIMIFDGKGKWAIPVPVKQMTIQEIEKELGYNIEIV